MAEVSFGGVGGSANTDQAITSGPINLPAGRIMYGGNVVALIYALQARVAGRSAGRTVTMALGSASVTFAVGAASHSVPMCPWQATSYWFVNGGTANLVITPSGAVNVDRAGGGATSWPGSSFSGTIGGTYAYFLPPTEPRTMVVSSPLPGRITASWIAPADNGGTAITGYRLTVATNSAFTTGVVHADVTGLSATINGLTPGTRYWVRVHAKNSVTQVASTVGMGSPSQNLLVKAGGRRWDGTAEVPTSAAMRWDGTAEVPITTAVRWDGTAEVPLT